MTNHDILSSALQKYYSALKSLDDFGHTGSFFDDVARLDGFFSEFRNITFVIQKHLETEKNKKIYETLRSDILTGETLRWFITTRNKITKEKPFPLQKELVIDIYLPHDTFRLKSDDLIVDFDETFKEALDVVKAVFIDKLNLIEINFSAELRFTESGSDVDLYPKIKNGIIQMDLFIDKIQEAFPCNCDGCVYLTNITKPIYEKLLFKNLHFIRDYAFEVNKELIVGDNIGMYFKCDNSDFMTFSDIRIPLTGDIYYDEVRHSTFDMFKKFISMHSLIFKLQKHQIMPVFMIIFSDETYQLFPFIATTRSTFYRNVNEIIDTVDFDDVVVVFYCGEFFSYSPERFSEVGQKPYSERSEMATSERLVFRMLLNQGDEWSISLDESKIDDLQYVADQIHNIQKIEESEHVLIDWLNPMKEKLRSSNKKD